MGEVWAATHEITGGRVALKFLKANVDARSDARRRFLREARASTLVDHPNVVPIRDVVDHADTPVLVMDLLTGETLAQRLTRYGNLELGDAARIALQVVAAVGAAHEVGVIHRDLKPENVFLSRATSGEVVRVLDFGIAKLMRVDPTDFGEGGVTQSGTLVGTPAYMAPEQVFGERNLDHRVDIWAIGVILHETLTGHRPIEGENYGQIAKKLLSGPIVTIATRRPDLPEDVIALVDGMLARERADRVSDLRKVVDVLARYSTAPRPSFGPPRLSLESDPNGKLVIGEDDVAPTRRAHDVAADTLIAGSDPEQRRSNTPESQVSSTTTPAPSTNKLPSRVGVPWIASGVLLVAALGVGVGVALSHRAPATAASVPPTSASPLVAPVPVSMTTFATVSASPPPPATAEPPPVASTSVAPSTTAKPTHAVPTGKWVPPVKSAATATATASAAPTPAPTPTPTNTGGLVTKPPF